MKLDPTAFRYITKDEFRVLTAVEMGMRNHELVPVPLIESIAKVTRGSTFKLLMNLLRNKLVAHDGKKYDGYRMTYHGYDFLALRALVARGSITGVGRRLGVGKESDVHYCQGPDGEVLALKLHRLGRISFRNIKEKRDYLQHRTHGSWMYMARLAAAKEFAYMKALKDEGFPVPTPMDQNRHCVVMSFVPAVPLCRLTELKHPHHILERLMRLIVRLARAGIVHGDFNEFNLMIGAEEKVTLIDFPQIVHLTHVNAEETFDRDVKSICDFFRKRMNIEVEQWPVFTEVKAEIAASGETPVFAMAPQVQGMGQKEDAMLVAAHESGRNAEAEGEGRRRQEGSDDEGDDEDDDKDDETEGLQVQAGEEGFEELVPSGGREALGEEPGDEEAHEVAGAPEGPQAEGAAEAPAAAGAAVVEGAATEAPPSGEAAAGAEEASDGEGDSSGSEASEGPGQVALTSGKKIRKKQTAKEARKNLQRQQKSKPAKANNQKVKETRRAKHEIKEYLCG